MIFKGKPVYVKQLHILIQKQRIISDELDTLTETIKRVKKLKNSRNKKKLLDIFLKVKDYLLKNNNTYKKLVLIERLPLLYLQIKKVSAGNKREIK